MSCGFTASWDTSRFTVHNTRLRVLHESKAGCFAFPSLYTDSKRCVRRSCFTMLGDKAMLGRRSSIAVLVLLGGVLPSRPSSCQGFENDSSNMNVKKAGPSEAPTPISEAVSGFFSGSAVSVAKQDPDSFPSEKDFH